MRLGGLKWALSYAHIREQGLAPTKTLQRLKFSKGLAPTKTLQGLKFLKGLAPTNTLQGLKFLWPCIRRSLPLRANSELAGGLDQARALTFRRQACSRGSV